MSFRLSLPAALVAAMLVHPVASAQDAGPGTGGAVAARRAAKAVEGQGRRVLMIGAHPDDEYTDLIALLSRGDGVDVAYLSLTRGEGGQNLIGHELGPALGILRTDELLAARAVDGGRQFFTRAYDFGFSKTADETFRFWPKEQVLEDVVRVIRAFRPQVIVSVWSGTPRDGHGQHTASGILAREAFDAAADPARFRGAGAPHRVSKFYLAPYTLPTDAPMLVLDGGRIEPASGLTMHQLAARSRSRHRSQDMGALEEPGPWPVRVSLAAVAPGITAGPQDSIFAGIPAEAPPQGSSSGAAALAARGIVFDAYADRDELARGDTTQITLVLVNNSPDTITARLRFSRHDWPGGGLDEACGDTVKVAPGRRHDCKVMREGHATWSQPYFLTRSLVGAMYEVPDSPLPFGRPFDAEPWATVIVHANGRELGMTAVPIRGRSLDQGLGEVRRPLAFVPRVSVGLQPGTTVWPRGVRTRTFDVQVEHLARGSTTARIVLAAPAGWRVSEGHDVTFTRSGERRTIPFTVTPPPGARDTTVTLRAAAIVGRDTLRLAIHRIDYPHVPRRVYFTDAAAAVAVADIRFPALARAGYVRGAADLIPEALHGAGVPVRVVDGDALAMATLDSLELLVIGPRAYEVNDALRHAHPRIMQWVERGGTLVVQYQQYQYVRGGFAPVPFTIASPHDRVTDEAADVSILAPTHPLFRFPNPITAADFAGWRQERGLYFAGTWDARWAPLLEMHDPGEAPKRGGLLAAEVGRGRVVYTGLAFFRQLPAGVPGAWRLFANLLALGERRAR